MSDSALPRPQGRVAKHPAAPYPAMSFTYPGQRLLHNVLVAMNSPASWPGWLIGCVAFLPIVAVACLWWFLVAGREAAYLGIALTVFALADALVLISARRWRLSFGPIGPQLFTLELPRLAVALLAIPAGVWLGSLPALIGVLVINFGASLALVWGALLEPRRLGLSRVSLANPTLPQGAPPLRLLHLTDLHIERYGRREEQLLRLVRTARPDLILLTGDYVNLSYVDDPIAHADARRILEALSSNVESFAPGGVFAVLGSPTVDRNSASLFEGLSIRLLRDEVVTIDLPVSSRGSEQSRRLVLIGLDCSHDPERDAARLAEVAAQVLPGTWRVLLYHSPELMPVAPEFGIDLYLCGHTHGGQVRLPLYGALVTASRLGKRFEMGCYRRKGTHLYVSRGIGFEGLGAPRVRFLCPPEITLISLNGREEGHQSCDKTSGVW